MAYEINTEIVFSTSHITKAENDILEDPKSNIANDPYSYGHRVYTNTDTDAFKRLPNVLRLLEIARGHECKWLVLDCDGPVEDLPTFDW